MLARDAFGMKLHAVNGPVAMRNRHYQAVVGLSRDLEILGRGRPVDHEGMIARGVKRAVHPAKQAARIVRNPRDLAVHGKRRAHHPSAEDLTDRLMAEADAEYGLRRARRAHQIQADARFVGRARAGREHQRIWLFSDRLVDRNFVVAPNLHVGAELADIVDEVEGETVVIVDQGHAHRGSAPCGSSFHGRGGRVKARANGPGPRSGDHANSGDAEKQVSRLPPRHCEFAGLRPVPLDETPSDMPQVLTCFFGSKSVPSLLFFRTQLLQQNQRGNRLFLVSEAKQPRGRASAAPGLLRRKSSSQ